MSDHVKGIAVLDREKHQLSILCQTVPNARYPQGKSTFISLEVGINGNNGPHANPWQVREEGDVLHCHPSVRLSRPEGEDRQNVDFFHNGYSWTVKFVTLGPGEDSYDKMRELNPDRWEEVT